MDNRSFLNWIADRLVNVYGESENVDFVRHLREIADIVAEKDREIARLRGLLREAEVKFLESSYKDGVIK